ncbi:MAG: hypothetical protein JW787_14220 [Sedimentisphaerales bacterium]|nr:hypothetical protein [Sedimentisphaerales bacterium]
MARKISIVTIITLVCISMGCQSTGSISSGQLAPRTSGGTYYPGGAISAAAGEIDIIEIVEKSRTQYKESLEALINLYAKQGNNEKQRWAEKELDALNIMPQYDYVPVLLVEGLEPVQQIMDADLLYDSAMMDKRQAERFGIALANKNLYRSALTKFRKLIRTYEKSDKIDDAAFEAGVISENLKDYYQALEYYKASFKWDPQAVRTARFRAARILDRYMKNYAEALTLYREAVDKEAKFDQNLEWKKNAEERIKELEKTVTP